MTSHELAQKLLALPDLQLRAKVSDGDQYGSYYWFGSLILSEEEETHAKRGINALVLEVK